MNEHHPYATRIRLASRSNFPQFPIPGIVLHPDDANSKVFLAIGRSFLSVDNRAMTIKDLAELTVNFGLVCQNLSAASQAITTYIRSHMQRCESQQDQPLLLRHTLSGTPDDDDLLPALYSRSGGAHCNASHEGKITNFRKGTMVWYMSRTTGAPCPFARAGIRLCDYGEDGKVGSFNSTSKEKRRAKEKDRRFDSESCGQKRKRSLRRCVAKGLDSDNDPDCPPPKVKLTLRLKPLQSRASSQSTNANPTGSRIIDLSKDSSSEPDSSQDDSLSTNFSSSSSSEGEDDDDDEDDASPPPSGSTKEDAWSLPPYPRKSISIPCYVPAADVSPYAYSSSANQYSFYRRSPSLPYSIGSPPPDSEDEDDDFHITMTGARRHSTDPRSSVEDHDGWDADLDSEGDGEVWESPGPRSPSAPVVLPEVSVKEEPTDVQGMLEAWEDFDSSLAGAKVVEVLAKAAAGTLVRESASHVKTEPFDSWSWESSYTDPNQDWSLAAKDEFTERIKEEDIDLENPFNIQSDFGALGPSSPISPLSHLPNTPHLDSSSSDGSPIDWSDSRFATIKPRNNNSSSILSHSTSPPSTSFSLPLTPQRLQQSATTPSKPDLVLAPVSSVSLSLATLIQSLSMNSPTALAPSSLLVPPSCISPHETRGNSFSDVVVVHTCQPCTPSISATQVEGISVYQMMLGAFQLLRRIDTDFVNLSPIVAYSGAPWPVLSTISNAVTVTRGSPAVSGTWVPLVAAQRYMRDHQQLQNSPLSTFLSDTLFERFPSALQDFHRSSTQGRMLGHFGPHFGSTLQATQLCGSATTDGVWEHHREEEQGLFSVQPNSSLSLSFPLATTASAVTLPLPPDRSIEVDSELPLSATEQEIFHALCDIPDWEKENSAPSSPKLTEHQVSAMAVATAAAVVAVPASVVSVITEGTQQQRKEVLVERVPPNAKTTMTTAKTKTTMSAASGGRPERPLPLRRSKRVAEAIAAQSQTHTRTRSRRGGTKNSLS